MSDVDHYDLQNAVSEAKSYADDKDRDLDYRIDDVKRDLEAEINHLQRQVDELKRLVTNHVNSDSHNI